MSFFFFFFFFFFFYYYYYYIMVAILILAAILSLFDIYLCQFQFHKAIAILLPIYVA